MAVFAVVTLAGVIVFGFANAPRDARGYQPIFSCHAVVLLGVSLYVLLPAVLILTAGDYTWAPRYYSEQMFANTIWLSTLGVLAFLYGSTLLRNRRPAGTETDVELTSERDTRIRTVDGLLITLLGIGLALKIILIIYSGGFAEAVVRLSGYAREFSGIASLDASAIQLRTVSGIADGAATWGMIRAIRNRHHQKVWLLILAVTLGLTYMMIGKRLVFLLPVLCVVVAIHVYRKPLTMRLLPIVLALSVGVGFLSLSARIFLPASMAGFNINLNNVSYADGSVLRFYLYSLEFSTVEMMTVAITARDEILGMFGGVWNAAVSTNIEPFFYSVPRALWPGKPTSFYDVSYGISAALGISPFEEPTVGFASTIIGTWFVLGGVIGVGIAMFLLGAATGVVDRQLMRRWSEISVVMYALALVVAFNLFRQGTLGWTFIISIVQQYGALLALFVLSFAARPRRSRSVDPATAAMPARRRTSLYTNDT